ncbi:MAG: sodium:proton antiporter [Chitinophagales bacterium]|nr:sodium:proton antiporter [Chitinophagaceae bacterium]MCB9064224.1 sodium:proton antiporter [Chitinophagales bacterium]
MKLYTVLTVIISISAVFAYINYRYIKLPNTIGIMVMSLICSALLVTIGHFVPSWSGTVIDMIRSIDFQQLLMDAMLSFLLFAGAIHVNYASLKREKWPIAIMATIGTLISTFVVGYVTHLLFGLFDMQVGFVYCLLFGALISPTDPIAVLGILKRAKIPHSIELKVTGESLFNDGVAVVVFVTIMQIARAGLDNMSPISVGELFLVEAVGGIIYGIALGYVGFFMLRSIDNYQVEVLITVAIVMGGYSLASVLHISGPLAMVVAGIITGNQGKEYAMSHTTRDYLGKFWEVIDEILNAILFLLIGFELLVIEFDSTLFLIGAITILVVLAARLISVAFPLLALKRFINLEKNAIGILTWGGLRGGISVALALSLPDAMYRSEFVTITYVVVVFSIIVQGLTIGKLAKRVFKST